MNSDSSNGFSKSSDRRMFISLRHLATLAAASLVTITVVVIMWVNEQSIRKVLVNNAQTQLVLEARNLAITGADALLSEFPELTLVPLVKDILGERPEILDVVITNHEGKIQGALESRAIGTIWQKPQGLQPMVAMAQLGPGERMSESDKIILMECPIHYDQESDLGWVAIVLDKDFIEAMVRQSRNKLITIATILLGLSIIITAILMSNLFRPISLLREGLESIGHGDLDTPMHVRDFTELGMLADTVNKMAGQLKTSQNLVEAHEQEVLDTQKEVITTLGQVVESRSSETANHTLRVGDMSYELALLAGLSPDEAELIRASSPMHDVGKIGIPDHILNKPGKLTLDEYRKMKDHPGIGFNILNKSERPLFKAAAIIAHEHHERWDGMGYPRNLKGDEIHLYGRIVGLVDVFDAIFSNRVYRKAMPLNKALEIIREEKGNHFDPRLADLFLNNLPKFLAITEQYGDQEIEEAVQALSPEPVHS